MSLVYPYGGRGATRVCTCLLLLLFPVVQLCLTLCGPMECSTPGLPEPHYLPKFAQVHVHCIGICLYVALIFCTTLKL